MRTVGCGICRTDLHMIDGLAYRPRLPHILGHEPAGTVARLGPGVTGLARGARVAPGTLLDGLWHAARPASPATTLSARTVPVSSG